VPVQTRAFFLSEFASSLAMVLAAVARTVFLPSVDRNNRSLQDVCAFKIGISSIRFVDFSKRATGVGSSMLDTDRGSSTTGQV
jgi:hypothetical protein